jgi:hypothetical protein
LTVVAALARAEFGIALAATARLGVVVEFVTVGTSHVGHEPEGAAKEVTVPEPPPLAIHAPDASQTCVPVPPVAQVTACELALEADVMIVEPSIRKPAEKLGAPEIVAGVIVPKVCAPVQVFVCARLMSRVVAVLLPPTVIVVLGEVMVSPPPLPLAPQFHWLL